MDAAFGMEYLHSKNIVHFDLKCDNLLVNLKDPLRPICKVYLFISSQRIVGCLVAEPIKNAYRVRSRSMAPVSFNDTNAKEVRSNSTILDFGDVNFQREVVKRAPCVNSHEVLERDLNGAIFCEKDAVTALYGIRVIWVRAIILIMALEPLSFISRTLANPLDEAANITCL